MHVMIPSRERVLGDRQEDRVSHKMIADKHLLAAVSAFCPHDLSCHDPSRCQKTGSADDLTQNEGNFGHANH